VAPAETSPEPARPVESATEEFARSTALAGVVAPVVPPSVEVSAPATKSASSDDVADFGHEAFAALVKSQKAFARGLEALNTEIAGLALAGIDAAARTATDMLGIKTLSDAIEVNAGLTRSSFDTLVGGSAKLSELGVRLAAEASEPILTQLGKNWLKAARFTV
jgi:hypothetical protein